MTRTSKYTEEIIQEIAQSKGGDLVEIIMVNNQRKAKLICGAGHEWIITPRSINKTWCLKCSGSEKNTIEQMQEHALTKNGKCLSKKYVNLGSKLRWECEFGHTWKAIPRCVRNNGTWCPECHTTFKPTQMQVEQLAADNGGLCLSTYTTSAVKMEWQCAKGHTWEAAYNTIQQKHWCPQCGYKAPTQEQVDALARRNGGECLSVYENCRDDMRWKCEKGHTWKATYNNIRHTGTWCPKCRNKTEQYCRSIFECLFGCEFPNTRPKWMLSKKGFRLELDGYNDQIDVAFEYNGQQHYEVIPHFQMTEKKLLGIQARDKIKVAECDNRCILLIVIPYTLTTKKQIRLFIYKKLWDETLTKYTDADLPETLLYE
jgi:hypothetical protein